MVSERTSSSRDAGALGVMVQGVCCQHLGSRGSVVCWGPCEELGLPPGLLLGVDACLGVL